MNSLSQIQKFYFANVDVRQIDLGDQGTLYGVHAYPFPDAAKPEATYEKFRQLQRCCSVAKLD